MIEEFKKQYSSVKLLTFLLIIAVFIYLAQIFWQLIIIFSDIILILFVSWLLSFILEPLVLVISKISKLPKVFSALLVYIFFGILFTIMIFLFIPVIINESEALSKLIPNFLSQYPSALDTWNRVLVGSLDTLISLIPSLANTAINIFLILILSFYLVIDKDHLNNEIYKLLPKSWHNNFKFIQNVIDNTFSSFFRIQVIFALVAGISSWIILTILGVEFAAIASVFSGILTLIPVLGQFLGVIPAVFVVLVSHPGNYTQAIIVLVALIAVQQIVFNVFGPKILGKAFKLHPIIVFISILVGVKIAGALGAVFAIPILGIAVVVLKELGHYFINPVKPE